MKKLALLLLPLVGCGGNGLKTEMTNLQNHILSITLSLNEVKAEAGRCSRDKESLQVKLSAADAAIARLSGEITKLRANQKLLEQKSSYRSQQQDLKKQVTGGSGSK